MEQNNTLFLLARFGLRVVDKSGVFESWMWILDEKEMDMQYVSFHKSKADRAYKGGKVLQIRDASAADVEEHQALMDKLGEGTMEVVDSRKIIVFQLDPKWNKLWPESGKSNPMAYKALGYLDIEEG